MQLFHSVHTYDHLSPNAAPYAASLLTMMHVWVVGLLSVCVHVCVSEVNQVQTSFCHFVGFQLLANQLAWRDSSSSNSFLFSLSNSLTVAARGGKSNYIIR